ncbi:hypothetical protein [Argonema galeatum]|uniref:hypothetical protein n=1 Tax=Argonema galeatum TaxID=2942762 RepID=UPI002010FA12|nr:hypothetical protein [Argonema galeatum]MCL1468014.1 hypothetical protein [Argonema galeatum A003/A1]
MNLSFKDIRFIIEAIDHLIDSYEERIEVIEDEDEDEASDLGNDCKFLEALRKDLEKILEQNVSPTSSPGMTDMSFENIEGLSWQKLVKPVLELSMNERLRVIDAITESIRQEITANKIEDSSEKCGMVTDKVVSA